MISIRQKKWAAMSLSVAVLALLCIGARAQDAAAIVKAADRYRLSDENMQLQTQISIFNRDGSLDKDRAYTVFAQTNHQSLVLMQSPAEKGQKVLMLGDDFWLLLPGSQRPLRITASQRLFGSASTGDVATLRWAQDFSPTLVGEERCGEAACLHLTLTALRKTVNYQRIELWVGKARFEPLKADLYLQSDKLAKQASFVFDKPVAPTAVIEMVLRDTLSDHKETRIRYLARKPKQVPETWLNPMFLAKNPSLE